MQSPRHFFALVFATTLMLSGAASAAERDSNGTRIAAALDRAEIIELSAHFDNALDAEDKEKFVKVFTGDGVLQGFWGQSRGTGEIEKAFQFMLATFSKDKRHIVTNHEVNVTGDKATMFCYLTVLDRNSLAITGTATFRDDLVRTKAGWRFKQRTLAADRNVDPIIEKLKAAH